jgi:hypothetical protein
LTGLFKSPALEAFLTSPRYTDRILGASTSGTFATNILALMTGNNLLLGGDMWRRVLTCRIDAGSDPEKRSFGFHPVHYVRRNRQKLAHAALTIIRAYVTAGSPRTRKWKLGSFEAWDQLVCGAVEWITAGDKRFGNPLACVDERKAAAPERVRLLSFLEAVHAVHGEKEWTVSELIKGGERDEDALLDPDRDSANEDRLRAALEQVPGAMQRGGLSALKLGYWLRDNVGVRDQSGLRVVRVLKADGVTPATRDGSALWKLQP